MATSGEQPETLDGEEVADASSGEFLKVTTGGGSFQVVGWF